MKFQQVLFVTHIALIDRQTALSKQHKTFTERTAYVDLRKERLVLKSISSFSLMSKYPERFDLYNLHFLLILTY